MPCPESLRVQAYFDGEVDAVTAADIEGHLEHCAECSTLRQDLQQTRSALRSDLTYTHAAPELRVRLNRILDRERVADPSSRALTKRTLTSRAIGRMQHFWRATSRPFWMGAGSGVGLSAAAVLAFFLISLPFANPLVDDLLSAHVRSLMSNHLIDVASTDKHTVKPWFAGHTDVSPVVADFEQQGYRLVGGRADSWDHQRAAVVVYQHGPHFINVFSWAGNGRSLPEDVTRHGYHLAFWKAGDLDYCAISDTAWDELRRLTQALKDLSARE